MIKMSVFVQINKSYNQVLRYWVLNPNADLMMLKEELSTFMTLCIRVLYIVISLYRVPKINYRLSQSQIHGRNEVHDSFNLVQVLSTWCLLPSIAPLTLLGGIYTTRVSYVLVGVSAVVSFMHACICFTFSVFFNF